jgi:hypothetical protein
LLVLFLVLIVGLLIVGAIAGSSNRSRIYDEGRRLHSAFVELGSMKGKPFSELKQAVGLPTSISHHANGTRLRQWQATGFHMAILFDKEDRVVRITHQYTKLPR